MLQQTSEMLKRIRLTSQQRPSRGHTGKEGDNPSQTKRKPTSPLDKNLAIGKKVKTGAAPHMYSKALRSRCQVMPGDASYTPHGR